jgi:uncharacterized protein YcbX
VFQFRAVAVTPSPRSTSCPASFDASEAVPVPGVDHPVAGDEDVGPDGVAVDRGQPLGGRIGRRSIAASRSGAGSAEGRSIGDHPRMTEPAGRVAWIAIAPVKSMALVFLERAELGLDGIPGDRAYAVIDEHHRLVNGKRAGTLATVRVELDPGTGTLSMRLPDGEVATGIPDVGGPTEAIFLGAPRPARAVEGPWSSALAAWSGQPLRLVAMGRGVGTDRGPSATLLSSAALDDLATAGGAEGPLDRRRFRMTFGVDGVPAYAEDGWIGRDIRIGEATVRVAGNVGRCAVTTHDPDTGRRSFDTLHALQHHRGHLASSEPLPFGVWAEVLQAGPVAVGDLVAQGAVEELGASEDIAARA